MLTLVEDLMNVSIFESGQMHLSPEVQSLEQLVDHAVTLRSPMPPIKGYNLKKSQATCARIMPFKRSCG